MNKILYSSLTGKQIFRTFQTNYGLCTWRGEHRITDDNECSGDEVEEHRTPKGATLHFWNHSHVITEPLSAPFVRKWYVRKKMHKEDSTYTRPLYRRKLFTTGINMNNCIASFIYNKGHWCNPFVCVAWTLFTRCIGILRRMSLCYLYLLHC